MLFPIKIIFLRSRLQTALNVPIKFSKILEYLSRDILFSGTFRTNRFNKFALYRDLSERRFSSYSLRCNLLPAKNKLIERPQRLRNCRNPLIHLASHDKHSFQFAGQGHKCVNMHNAKLYGKQKQQKKVKL